MKPTYIITGANGDIAISIADILKDTVPNVFVVGTDSSSRWPAAGTGFDEVQVIPKASGKGYADTLQKLVADYGARYVIPTSEPELRWIAKNQEECRGIPFLMNDPALILTCMDKLESIRFLEKMGIAVPATKLWGDATPGDIPFILKPRYGAGSRNIRCVENTADYTAMSADNFQDEMVCQAFLEGEDREYTCVIVKLEKEYRTFIMHRKLNYGVTTEMHGLQNPAIEEMLNIIAEHLPSYSDINVQLRLTPDGPRIFEINPRFSSTIKMRHMLGFSDFVWLLDGVEKKKSFPDVAPILGKKIYRIYKEVMGDDDASHF